MANSMNPGDTAVAVTKSDSTVVNFRSLYIGTTGDLVIDTPNSTNVLFKAVAVGWFPMFVTKVRAATTAADIVGIR